MAATSVITLPHGLWDGRRRRSSAELRTPTGADEAYLLSEGGRSRAEQVTALLGRCLVRVEDLPVGDELVRELTVGDREALLLHLRAATFGDRCPARSTARSAASGWMSTCVSPSCSSRRTRTSATAMRFALADGEAVVRLATGADQEAAARHDDPSKGLEELIERCVLELKGAEMPPVELADALSGPLAELDPQAELTVDAVCPSCGEPLTGLVDAATILFAELTGSDERLLREVDAIARVYHWGEDEILGLDVLRRRRYLELLAETGDEGP